MVIDETAAFQVLNSLPTLDDARKERAARMLRDYEGQQARLGQPLWPSRVAELEKRKERTRSVFDNPLVLDAEDGTYQAADAVEQGAGERMRKREANILFLADKYQADETDVRQRFDFYKADMGAKWGTGTLDDEAFFGKAKGEVEKDRATETRRQTVAQQAAQTALTGGSFLDAMVTSGAEDDEDKRVFRESFGRVSKKLAPYRGLIQEVASEGKRMMTSGEGADWSALADRLMTVPKDQRGLVLDALGRMEGEQVEGGATKTLLHAFARGLENYIDRAGAGAAGFVREQVAARAEFAVGVADAVGMGSEEDGRMLNQIDAAKERSDEMRELAQDARAIAAGTLSPLRNVELLGMNLTGAVENLPMTAGAFIPIAGPASMVAFFKDATDEELRREYPDMDRTERQKIATLSAPIQAATEVIFDRLLFGRLPNLKRVFTSPALSAVSIGKQLAGRVALGTATETVEELAQGVTSRAVMEIQQALGADVPNVNWQGYFSRFGDDLPELLSTVVPLALIGAGTGQVSDFQNARALVGNEALLKAAGYENAADIKALADAGQWRQVEGLMREQWAKVAPKGESVGEVAAAASEVVIQQQTESVKAATEEVRKIAAENEEARRVIEQAEARAMIPRIRKDAQGWSVVDVETGATLRVQTREDAVAIAYEGLSELERTSSAAMAQTAEEFMGLAPNLPQVVELNKQAGTMEREKREGRVTAQQGREAVELYGIMHGLKPGEARAEAVEVLGNNKAEEIEGVRAAVSRIWGGGNLITVMHEGIHGRWRAGLEKGHYTQNMGVQWVRMAERASGQQFLPVSDDAAVTPAMLDEAIVEVATADLIGKRKDAKQHFTPGLISRGVASFALSQRADAKAAGRFATWLRSWKDFWGRVLRNAKALKKARAEGKLDGDFDAFLDDLLGAEPQQRFEAEAAREAVEMVGEVDNAPFSLSPRGMASDDGAAQNAEPSTGGLTESEVVAKHGQRIGSIVNEFASVLRDGDPLLTEGEAHGFEIVTDELKDGEVYISWIENKTAPKGTVAKVLSGLSNLFDLRLTPLGGSQAEYYESLGFVKKGKDMVLPRTSQSDSFESSRAEGGVSFSLAPRSQQDAAYLAAVEAGDMETAQRMVDEVATGNKIKGEYIGEDYEAVARTLLKHGNVQVYGGPRIVVKSKNLEATIDIEDDVLIVDEIEAREGAGSRMLADMFAAAQEADIETVKLIASRSLGGWFWANRGFDPETLPTKEIKRRVDLLSINQDVKDEVIELLEDGDLLGISELDEEILPSDYAILETKDELMSILGSKPTPLGKVLLVGTRWDAIKEIDGAIDAFPNGQIKSAAPVTRDDAGNVIPLSQRFTPSDDIRFSLAPRSLASVADTVLAAQMRKPEFREALYRVAREKMDRLRAQSVDEMTGRIVDKTEAEWNREMKAREGFEYDRLLRENFGANTTKKQEELPVVDRQAARSEARTFAERWLQGEKKKQPTKKDRQMAALRTLDAILSAFPIKIRDRVGGFVKLASLGTDKAREAEIVKRLEKLDRVVEKEAKKHYLEAIAKDFKRFGIKKDDKGRITSNVTAAAAEEINFAYEFAEMDDANQDKEMAGLEKTIDESEDFSEQQDAIGKLAIANLFYKLEGRDSAELEATAEWLNKAGSGAREARKVMDAARAEWVKEAKNAAKADAANGKLSSLPDAENVEADARSSTFKRFTADVKGFLNSALFTMGQQLEIVFGQDSRITTEFHKRAVKAANQSTDIKRDIEGRRAAFVAQLFGTQSRIKQAGRMGALTVPTASGVVVTTGGKTKTIDVPGEVIERIIAGTADLKALGLTTEEAATLADEWAINDSLPGNRRKSVFQVERRSEGQDVELTMSQDEAIQYLLWSKQAASREQMERDGWSEESLAQLDAFLSDDAKALAGFFADEYARLGLLINPVYRRMFNAPFPQVRNYSPIFRDISRADSIIDLDQQGQGSGVSSGFILARNKNARSAMRRTSGISNFMQHAESASHWIAHVELVRDLRAVLTDKEVQNAIRSNGRTAAANGIKKRVMQLENQGKVGAAGIAELDSWGSRLLQARAFKGLAWRIGPVMKQTSAFFNPLLADVPAWDYMRGTARLLSGELDVSAMWSRPEIQRRIIMGFSAESKIAMDRLGYTGSTLIAAMGKGMLPMSLVDAGWTTAGAAIAFDFYRKNNIKSGMNETQAEAAALDQLEMMIAESAQPADAVNRSLIEGLQNPWLKSIWMFASESRKTLAVEIMALRRLATGKSKNKAMDIQRAVVAHVVMGTTTQLMSGILSLLMGDEDDREREWSIEQWAAAIAAGPINGLFLFGDALNYIGRRLFGLHAFEPSTAIGQAVKTVSSAPGNLDKVINGDPEEQRKAFLRLGEAVGQAAALVGPGNPFTAADVILGNPLKDADKILTRITE